MGVRMKPECPRPGQKRRRRDPGTPQPSAAVTNASASDEKSASPDRTRTGARALDGHLRSIRGGKLARDQAASTAVMRRLMLETFMQSQPRIAAALRRRFTNPKTVLECVELLAKLEGELPS